MKIAFLKSLRFLLYAGIVCIINTACVFAQHNDVSAKQGLNDAKSAYINGVSAFENEDYQEALNLLKKASAKLGNKAGVNFALADVYLQMGDLDNATLYGRKATELESENHWYHLKLAAIYQKAGKNEATIKELKTALRYHPNDSNTLFKLAQIYIQLGKRLEANTIYNRLIQLEGPNINFHLQKLKNFSALDMQDSIAVELQKIHDLDPDNLSVLQKLSEYYLKKNQLSPAKEALHKALEINEQEPKTLIMLSEVYMSEGKWDSVSSSLSHIISDSSVSHKNKIKIAEHLISQFRDNPENGELQKATTSIMKKLVESEPHFSRAQSLAANFFTQTQQNVLALQALERATELSPANDRIWRQRLQLLLIEGRTKEAITVGKKAVENVPHDAIILFFLGNAYLANKNYTEAIKRLKEAANLPARKQFKSNIRGSLGNAYAGLEQWDQAYKSYDQSLALQSQNAVVLNNYAYFLSLQKQHLDQAKEMARKANKLVPQNGSYLDTLGWIYFQEGSYKKAKEYIKASLETGESSAEVIEHMGDVMNKLNKPEQADDWWRKALEKDSTRTQLRKKISD